MDVSGVAAGSANETGWVTFTYRRRSPPRLQCYVNSTPVCPWTWLAYGKICLSFEISACRFVPSVVLFVQPTEKKRTSHMNMLSDNFPRIFTFDMKSRYRPVTVYLFTRCFIIHICLGAGSTKHRGLTANRSRDGYT